MRPSAISSNTRDLNRPQSDYCNTSGNVNYNNNDSASVGCNDDRTVFQLNNENFLYAKQNENANNVGNQNAFRIFASCLGMLIFAVIVLVVIIEML